MVIVVVMVIVIFDDDDDVGIGEVMILTKNCGI